MAEDADTIVDVHYQGLFTPTPLIYFDGVKALIQEEEVDLEDEDLVSIDDVDSILEDGLKAQHVKDNDVISLKRNFNDPFVNKLCPIQNDDLVEEDHNAI
ncbi:unnamed protein product [Lactuca saligna]|uniref:Uncharacterized protein n=1 Tax=Lactuca saligna TaxID=75948 RepID=A0AA36ELT2_LACSI|nr:unnamed protein product [Lactuca saligna]